MWGNSKCKTPMLSKKILTAIELEYDLDYGETLLDSGYFYGLVEGFYPTITPPTKNEHDESVLTN